MPTLLRKILRDLLSRRLRNSLTLLGVILGVAGVVAIAATTRTMVDAQRLTYNSSNQADLAAFTGSLSVTAASLIERQDNVEQVATRSVTTTQFSTGSGWENVRLIGPGSFDDIELEVPELVEGTFPEDDEIAFDESAQEIAPIRIGDLVAIRESPADETTYLTVSGFTRSPAVLGAGIMNRAVAYTQASTVQSITGRSADNYLLVRVQNPERASQTAAEISGLLAKRGVQTGTFDVRDPNEFVGSRELGTLLLLLRVFSIMGAALAAFLVANTLTAVMSEETTQIGIVKSLGGQRWQISLTYLVYSGTLGLVGGVSGLLAGEAAGYMLSSYLTGLTGLQQPGLSIAPNEIGLAFLVGGAVTIVSTLVPSIRNAGQRVAPLLGSPGVRAEFQRPVFRMLSAPIAQLNPSAAVGLRNIVRRPGRTGLTIVVVAVAVAAFVSTQALSSSVSGTVDDLYNLYGADGWVYFQAPVTAAYARDLGQLDYVTKAESWTSTSAAIGSTRTDVWGMPAEDPLYDYRLVEGQWLTQSNPPSAVLTSNLASSIGAETGDRLRLDISGRVETIQVVGIVNDSSTYLGNTATGKAFMTRRDVNRLLGLGQRADLFALKFRSSDPEAVNAALQQIEDRTAHLSPGTLAAYQDKQSAQQAINILTTLLNAMVVAVAVVGIAGIANTLFINITERRREFGILRAVGARSVHVITTLVSEGIALAIAGLLAGIVVGYPLARLLVQLTGAELFELTFYLSGISLVYTFVIALLTVAAVSTIPGLAAARMRPLQVLRYE